MKSIKKSNIGSTVNLNHRLKTMGNDVQRSYSFKRSPISRWSILINSELRLSHDGRKTDMHHSVLPRWLPNNHPDSFHRVIYRQKFSSFWGISVKDIFSYVSISSTMYVCTKRARGTKENAVYWRYDLLRSKEVFESSRYRKWCEGKELYFRVNHILEKSKHWIILEDDMLVHEVAIHSWVRFVFLFNKSLANILTAFCKA